MDKVHESRKEKVAAFENVLVTFFGYVLDLVIIGIIVAVLVILVRQFGILAFLSFEADVHKIIDLVLFKLILIELFLILISYLRDHHIKVIRILEIGIISLLREVIFKYLELDAMKVLATAVLILALGALYFVDLKFNSMK